MTTTFIAAPSPNHGKRIPTRPITLIVLHADASPSAKATLDWCGRDVSGVSYHVLIDRDGTAYRMVEDGRTAWHAGVSAHPFALNPKSVNTESLGLSFSNTHDGIERLTDAQIAVGQRIVAEWRVIYPTIRAVVTHKTVAPTRKTDPERIPNFRLADFA